MAHVLGMGDEERRQRLRQLLVGWTVTYPAMAYGMLGGDPNRLADEDHAWIAVDLRALGYTRRKRPYFLSAYTMSSWEREEWPEDAQGAAPYQGIPLRPDPDLADNRAAILKRKRDFLRRVDAMRD